MHDSSNGVTQDGSDTPNNRPTETCSLRLPSISLISADQHQVTILQAQVRSSTRSHVFFKFTTDEVLVFEWIVSSCLVNLLKTGLVVQKPVNTNPRLKVNSFTAFVL